MKHRTRLIISGLLTIATALVIIHLFSALPAQAASIEDITVTCQSIRVHGRTDVSAPYVKVQVVLASNLMQVLAVQTVSTQSRAGAKFDALLSIREAHLAVGTRVVVTAREWDGFNYLLPGGMIIGADCGDSDATPVMVMPTLEATSPYRTLTAISPTPTDIPPTSIPSLVATLPPSTPTSHHYQGYPHAITGADCSKPNAVTPTPSAKSNQ
jgi:hypothetical protein